MTPLRRARRLLWNVTKLLRFQLPLPKYRMHSHSNSSRTRFVINLVFFFYAYLLLRNNSIQIIYFIEYCELSISDREGFRFSADYFILYLYYPSKYTNIDIGILKKFIYFKILKPVFVYF